MVTNFHKAVCISLLLLERGSTHFYLGVFFAEWETVLYELGIEKCLRDTQCAIQR